MDSSEIMLAIAASVIGHNIILIHKLSKALIKRNVCAKEWISRREKGLGSLSWYTSYHTSDSTITSIV